METFGAENLGSSRGIGLLEYYPALLTMETTPVSPSTLTISPVLITDVAIPVPVTDGTPYSLHTMAAWLVSPPMSVTVALIFVNTGAHEGLVLGQTSISPG